MPGKGRKCFSAVFLMVFFASMFSAASLAYGGESYHASLRAIPIQEATILGRNRWQDGSVDMKIKLDGKNITADLFKCFLHDG